MRIWEAVPLAIHIASGYLALLAGTIVMIAPKKGKRHRNLGRTFFFSLLGVTASALTLAVMKHNLFLLYIGLFVFYQAYSGWKSIREKAKVFGWDEVAVSAVGLINGCFMLVNGSPVTAVFGGISLFLVARDVKYYRAIYLKLTPGKPIWLVRHIGMMVGSYIGTFTAFLVVNVKLGSPSWVIWLAPTILFVPLMQYWTWKFTRKPAKNLALAKVPVVILGLCALSNAAEAQPYVSGGKTRHRFAQLNLGVDTRSFFGPSATTEMNAAGESQKVSIQNPAEMRMTIGGTHFWGHADFYVAIPVARFGASGIGTSVETGARYFPWRIEDKKLRPFAGVAWTPEWYKQGDGVKQFRHRFPLSAGLVYSRGPHLFELSVGYMPARERNYYISPANEVHVSTQPYWIAAGYKIMLETSAGAEPGWKSGKTARLTEELGTSGKLDGLTLAVGPSTAFFLKGSSYNAEAAPYLGSPKFASTFPEYGIGYYWHKHDLQVNLAYRRAATQLEAYGYRQKLSRRALTAEAYKFFADYHGFAPFAGAALSGEWLEVREEGTAAGERTTRWSGVKPGIVAGWDIRPNRLMTWYLRTNIRWFPNLDVDMAGDKRVSMDQLEVNIIELVVFPNRMF